MRKLLIGIAFALVLLPVEANANVYVGVGGGGVSIGVGPGWGGWWGYSPGYPLYGYEYYRPDYAIPGPGYPYYYRVRPYGYHGWRPYYRRHWRRW